MCRVFAERASEGGMAAGVKCERSGDARRGGAERRGGHGEADARWAGERGDGVWMGLRGGRSIGWV